MLERTLHVLRLRWRSLARRREVEAQLADEIAYHLAEDADLRAGSRRRARRRPTQAARRAFGGVERIKEACRDARGTALVESIAKDLRYGARSLLRQPAYAVPAVLTLALGIGATTAVFALVDGILVSRLPYPAPDRLVTANVVYPGGGLAAARRALATMDVAAYADGHVFTLAGDGPAVRVSGATVSAELFAVLGVTPARRPNFRPGEDQAAARRRGAAERGVVAVALRRRSALVGRRSSSTGGRARSSACCRPASICRRVGPSSGCRWRSIRATPSATGPATSCRSSGGCGPVSPPPGPGRAAAVPARRAPAVPVEDARRLEPRPGDRAAADGARRRRRRPAGDPVGRGAGGADHRLRQRRQSQPVARRDARARDRHPHGDRRDAAAGSRASSSPSICCWRAPAPPAASCSPGRSSRC